MSDWPFRKLEELSTKIGSGATPRGGSTVYQDDGVAFIRSQNVLDNRLDIAGVAHITDEAARSLSGVSVQDHDVLINITGDSVARCCLAGREVLPARVSQHVAIIRPSPALDSRFLQAFLVNPITKEGLLSVSQGGGTRKALTKTDLQNLLVPTPPFHVQLAIAEVMGALDDKIAANRRVLEICVETLDAIFEHFVRRVEPRTPLNQLVSTQYGLTVSGSHEPGPLLLRVTDINKNAWIDYDRAPSCQVERADLEKYRVSRGDILVARMADPGKVGYVDAEEPESLFASYLVRLKARDPDLALFLFHFLRSSEYQDYAYGSMSGAVQKNMNAKVIVGTEAPVPAPEVLRVFNGQAEPLRWMMRSANQESAQLARLRDTLLPELMSGRLRVKDAEKQVEDVM